MSATRRERAVRSAVAVLVAVPALLASTGVASAHVEYVTDVDDPGDAVEFVTAALSEPAVVVPLALGGVALLGTMAAYLRLRPFGADVRAFRRAMTEYADLLPWLLRLSLGLPLVGAGFAGYLFTPIVTNADTVVPVRLFGVTVGFLLLFGLATRLVAGAALVSYLLLLVAHPPLFFAFEYAAGLLAIVFVGGGRPSADQVIARMAATDETFYSRVDPFYRQVALPVGSRIDALRGYVPTVVRLGLGVVFAYLAFAEKLLAPAQALAVVEKYGLSALLPVPPELWVVGAAVTELFLGLLLVVGFFTRASAAAAIVVFTTTLFGLPDDPVLAHISLFGLASALLITGGGPYSVDAAVFGTRDAAPSPAGPAEPAD